MLVDDHELFGRSLEITFSQHSDISHFYFSSQPNDVHQILNKYLPDIILMDIHLGQFDGIQFADELLKIYPIKLVFLSGFNLMEYQEKAKQVGAHGYIDKNTSISKLIEALRLLHTKNQPCFLIESPTIFASLTRREKEILNQLSNGFKQQTIANNLSISERTVHNHIYAINKKLGTQSVVESVIKSIELGIISINI